MRYVRYTRRSAFAKVCMMSLIILSARGQTRVAKFTRSQLLARNVARPPGAPDPPLQLPTHTHYNADGEKHPSACSPLIDNELWTLKETAAAQRRKPL